MRRIVVAVMLLSLVIYGCGPEKAESGKAAIETAKTMETAEQKAEYLVGQAKAFYNSKQFQDAVTAAQYVLRYLDKDSQAAQKLLEQAKEALTSQAKGAMEDAKKGLAGFGK